MKSVQHFAYTLPTLNDFLVLTPGFIQQVQIKPSGCQSLVHKKREEKKR
jgi:hypothetical protein